MFACQESFSVMHEMPPDYILVQDRSQLRAYKKNYTEPVERGHEVYLSMLPRNVLVQNIHKFLKESGEIFDIRLLMDFSGFNRGMCYAKFLKKIDARRAALILDGREIEPNYPVNIKMSFENCQLIIQNIPTYVSHQEVNELFTKLIGNGLIFISDLEECDKLKSYMLVYARHQQALEARRKLWPGIEQWNSFISVDWAEPPELKQLRHLYFQNVPENCTRLEFFNVLNNLIDIQSVLRLKLELGIGYLLFSCHATRKVAMKILSGSLIFGRKLQLSYKKFIPIYASIERVNSAFNSKEDKKPFFSYQSCRKEALEAVPIIFIHSIYSKSGFVNQLQTISDVIQKYLNHRFPNSFWKCLSPEEKQLPDHSAALRIRINLNSEMYEFVMLCISGLKEAPMCGKI